MIYTFKGVAFLESISIKFIAVHLYGVKSRAGGTLCTQIGTTVQWLGAGLPDQHPGQPQPRALGPVLQVSSNVN